MIISRPTLLLDKNKCLKNIERIASKASRSGVRFRPHFKTHQSHEIARWFRTAGVKSCAVSSLSMAAYFAEDGWRDITVAFPINPGEINLINDLAKKVKLNVLVSSTQVLPLLAGKVVHPIHAYIDIDTGYARTGFQYDDFESIDAILSQLKESDFATFEGFLSHAGHTYKSTSAADIREIHSREIQYLKVLRENYQARYPDLQISIGDTPSCSIVDVFAGVDEIRPGNLVFYDLVQASIGSCSLDEIALAMACPIVAIHPERNEVVIYGGAVHFSKDSMKDGEGRTIFGRVVKLIDSGWELPPTSMFIKSLSQEHGIIHAPSKHISALRVGDTLGILPVHACLTADVMGEYHLLDGQPISRLN